jgi:hypothetical protein
MKIEFFINFGVVYLSVRRLVWWIVDQRGVDQPLVL